MGEVRIRHMALWLLSMLMSEIGRLGALFVDVGLDPRRGA